MARLTSLLASTVLVSFACREAVPAGEAVSADPLDSRQILWQRSLEDALALAQAEDRPLLIAVNMDGESASDRIVRENYRDPAFVAATRPFVCLVASVFRHNPRDYDDQGRRIPCPRLGECTCGEHMALEPLLFEKFLFDGERVAPRHALVLQGGQKAWDISLSFDLRDIDAKLLASARDEAERRSREPSEAAAVPSGWPGLASSRDSRGRARLEEELAKTSSEKSMTEALAAIAAHGDAGSAAALRVVVARLPGLSPEFARRFLDTVRARNLQRQAADLVRDSLRQLDALPGDPEPTHGPRLLSLLAALDDQGVSTRSLLLACRALQGYGQGSAEALALALEPDARVAVEAVVRAQGGPLPLGSLLEAATRVAPAPSTPTTPAGDAMPAAAELEQNLAELEASLRSDFEDPELVGRFAKASLDLGRQRIESQGGGVQDLLEDADGHFERALEALPERFDWWIERARTAYYLARFAEEVEYGRRAFALASGLSPERWVEVASAPGANAELASVLENPDAIEALRWIGDGHARLLPERSGGDPALEMEGILEGLRALGIVALSPSASPQDWVGFASFLGALGLWREEFAIFRAGVTRLPAARELRQGLNNALWNGGRFEQAPLLAERVAKEHGDSADARWFAGHAWLLYGELHRRAEAPALAIEAYAESQARFREAAALRADYAGNCRYWEALGWLGRGLAEVRAGGRTQAAECLVQSAGLHAGVKGALDGLGYDVFDLVDKIFEWRVDGPSPVEPLDLLARLEKAAPGDPFWGIAISDSQLREALRADGRNPERAMRDTVDAAGAPIRMLMGLPNEEGDAYLRSSIAAARRVLPNVRDENVLDEEDKQVLAQADTIWAERMLERGRLDGVAEALVEAAVLQDLAGPGPGADEATLRQVAAELRSKLGEARPRWRIGR